MTNKKTVAILCGGRSPEHRISLLSANSVSQHIDRDKYQVLFIGIDKSGMWTWHGESLKINHPTDANKVSLHTDMPKVFLSQNAGERSIIHGITYETMAIIDVIFPILHGTFGEDGSIQGLAKIADIPCVGCGILGSAVSMDKDVTKRLLRDSGIHVADFITLRRGYNDQMTYADISASLGKELFIKPANLGSSVGVSFVDNETDYQEALEEGFKYDPKVIIEEKITGREIECAVLGNDDIKASTIGEIVPKSGIYSFESKYVDSDGAALIIPAVMSDDMNHKVRELAIDTYRALDCKGMARVDLFLEENGRLIINEVNTIPGFTSISMYPKLWKESGLKYPDLISKLIDLAINEHQSLHQLNLT